MTKFLAVLIVLAGCSGREPPAANQNPSVPKAVEAPAPPAAALTYARIADRSTVCMVNDRFMGSAQIPVVVEGMTYYGCCKMCEKRLHDERGVRSAIDPISHEQVDKASAVLAQDKSGNVFYFASESTLKRANGGG